jgi:inner membrane protein
MQNRCGLARYNRDMDNLSHALSGLAAGELIHRCLPQENEAQAHTVRRRLLLTAGLLSASFPDLDLVLTPLLPEPLGYLLHHRGHTHTFLYALPQALLLAALLVLLWPGARRLLARSRTAMTGFCVTLVTGFILHMLMDMLNSYGIHPFHPFDSNWYYGDMVFIIEPLFWVAFGLPLFMMVRTLWLRWLLIASLAGAIAYFTVQGFLLWSSFSVLAGVGGMLALIQQRTGERGISGVVASVVICLVFIFGQGVASFQARSLVAERLKAAEPEGQILDAAMTPFPANPACWMFASIEQSGNEYRARRGAVSLAPGWLNVSDCPEPFVQIPAAQREQDRAFAVTFTHVGDRNSLHQLYERDCHFRAWMRFARIPAHNEKRAQDIRFDQAGDNFTLIDLERMPQGACPRHVPQWGVPRMDLLKKESGSSPDQAARRD